MITRDFMLFPWDRAQDLLLVQGKETFLKNIANGVSSLLDLWVKTPNGEAEFFLTVEEQKQLACLRS